jgi:hypothetical protein
LLTPGWLGVVSIFNGSIPYGKHPTTQTNFIFREAEERTKERDNILSIVHPLSPITLLIKNRHP